MVRVFCLSATLATNLLIYIRQIEFGYRTRSGTTRKRLDLPVNAASNHVQGPDETRNNVVCVGAVNDKNRKNNRQRRKEEHPNADTGLWNNPPKDTNTSKIAHTKLRVCDQTTRLSLGSAGRAWVSKHLSSYVRTDRGCESQNRPLQTTEL